VDLISYEVDSMSPFFISECSVGTAGACGSVYLNRSFEAALRKRLGKHEAQVLRPKTLAAILRNFDQFIKLEFKDDPNVPCLSFPIAGTVDITEAGIEDGFMTMTRFLTPIRSLIVRGELREIFLPVFEKVLNLIKGQIEQVGSRYGSGSLKVHVLAFDTNADGISCWWPRRECLSP